ncbi:ParB N-terminal domain-containing protein [Frigoriglobus tundricola]|uniref:ParB/Sulfiredoxin domain-containing protein n=1 Tax=Frigoriglobus tundricola TaxID=2774151 RepID=A0A6M5YXI4_9BACT|nr:hypothetical protein [Frigoriglobus tundricola]QJW98618.1 hypothetical protein FTUN_6213 [Frigoriglobus tundricola]
MARTETPTVTVGGLVYRLPHLDLFRPLTTPERDRLKASVAEHGVLHAVVTYDSHTFGKRCVIDGANRLMICHELEKFAPVKHRGELTDDTARELAVASNVDRRHLSVKLQMEVRAERVERVKEAKRAGASLRQIAQAEGVSHVQIRRDLGGEGVTPVTPEPAPEPTDPLTAARTSLDRLRAALDALTGSDLAPHLLRLIRRHEVEPAGLVAKLEAVLADLEAERVCGFEV